MRPACLLVAALALVPSRAGAQTGTVFNRTGSGARAAGMANAFIAVSDDGTAASWNPAGLGQLRKPELSVVTNTSRLALGAEGFRMRDDSAVFSPTHSAYSSTNLDFASLAVPLTIAGKSVTFQAAWRRLYTLDYRENLSMARAPLVPSGPPPALFQANGDVAGSVNLVSIAGAVKLTPRLALGGSFNLWRGDWTQDAALSETLLGDSAPPDFRMTSDANQVRGNNLSLGLMLTYPRWSIGVLYQCPLQSDFSNTTTTTTSHDPQGPPEGFDARLHFPQALGVGVAWRPGPLWTVALDLTWDDWTETLLSLPGGPTVNFFDGLPPGLSATRDTLSANVGAERLFHGEGFVVPLRFGLAWEPQGPRNAYTRDPVNYVMLAAGTGYNTNSLKFDAALQFRWTSVRDGTTFGIAEPDPYLPMAVGERTAQEWRVKVSVIFRIVDTEKLHRTLRKVFGGA
jgi:long-subunit fatty acid transport protein